MLREEDFADQWKKPPEEVISFFSKKGLRAGDKHWDWSDTLRHANDRAFVVSKVASLDLLKTIKGSLKEAIEKGVPFSEWEKGLTPKLQAAGWWGKQMAMNPQTGEEKLTQLGSLRRMRTIYDTNMRTAYEAGQHAKRMEVVEDMPYWTYRHNYYGLSAVPRATHQALDGLTFRWDDPFWDTHSPQNGWECNCGKVEGDARDVERAHGKPVDQAVTASKPEDFATKTVTVQEKQITVRGYRPPGSKEFVYPEPGWDYAPGDLSWRTKQLLVDADAKIPTNMPATREAFQKHLQTAIKKDFKSFVEILDSTGITQNQVAAVGVLTPDQAFSIDAKLRASTTGRLVDTQRLSTHLLLASDRKLVHAIREAKAAKGIGMPVEMLGNLPKLLESYEPRWDKEGGLLFFSEPFQDAWAHSQSPEWRWKVVFNIWQSSHGPQLRLSTATKVQARAIGLAEKL